MPPESEGANGQQRAEFLQRLVAIPWALQLDPPGRAQENMDRDLALLNAATAGNEQPVLRFYAWSPPAVSLGRFQDAGDVALDYALLRGWDVVRRPTGGRAVLHQFEVTYSLTLPPAVVAGVGVRTSHAVLTAALNAGLQTLLRDRPDPLPCQAPACDGKTNRSPNCFALASECDTVVAGGKLVGSAQVRRGGALLQHGSILLDAERDAWEALFGDSGRLLTLADLLHPRPAPKDVRDAIIRGYRSVGVAFITSEDS